MAWAVRRAGPRAAAGALDKARELFCDGRSREAWALLRAAAEARPVGAGGESDPDIICRATRVTECSMVEGQPWAMLAVQPVASRFLQQARSFFYAEELAGTSSDEEGSDEEGSDDEGNPF
jgi:hypothetical protein